jgi:hypothetical protein
VGLGEKEATYPGRKRQKNGKPLHFKPFQTPAAKLEMAKNGKRVKKKFKKKILLIDKGF